MQQLSSPSFRLLGWLMAASVLGACATHRHVDSEVQLGGTSWQLELMGERAALAPRPMLSFDGAGHVSGQASCNRYSAAVTVTGQAITFGTIAATRMACGDSIDAQESTYFAQLGKATRLAVEGDVMKIYAADGSALLQFLRVPAG
jgi:heat shock protein HslJ